jgi:hypothetical protein
MTAGTCVLHDLLLLYAKYCLSDEVKEDKMGGACRTYGEGGETNAYRLLVGKIFAKETTWKN